MSLLLEALKKAEKAKEEAQRRAQGESEAPAAAPAPAAAAPALELEAPVGLEPVRTRDQLPDIRQPLDFQKDEPAVGKSAEPRPAPELPRGQPQAEPQAAERASARKVFEAKFKEPNPRLPFFITMGVLGVFALGTVAYFWVQLRPPAPLVNTNPQRPAGEQQVAAAETRPAARAPAPVAQSAIPGLPTGVERPPAPKPAPQPVVRPPEVPRVEVPRLQPPPRRPEPAQAEISSSRATPQVHPKVGAGYAAYVSGDLATARAEYEQAQREEPANRDAALGLAALDVRAGRYEAAEGAYLRLLQADPRDAHAQAALIALRSGRVNPVAAESRVKSMLADNPGAHVLNFTLGNQFAQQGRWAEAQQEYFKAFAAEPDNADFAYNLAVSLDHLRQPRLALEYYRRALALAKARGASFDLMAAEARAAQLGR
jgi:tetratricopeptide (TPR) repeat protein